jgi:RNA polymerase sigma factor (sigma-70 family)
MTLEQLEMFYTVEYPKLVKLLVLLDAEIAEAEDAAQEAMVDYARRSQTAQAPIRNPAAYVRRAAVCFFIKERQRDRKRLPLVLRGGHLVTEAHVDVGLTAWEDEQYVELLIEGLPPTQRKVIKLVMDGLSTREIAEELGKSHGNIRQHLKNSRDRLKQHPDIALLASRQAQGQSLAQQGVVSTVATPEPRKEEVQ